ncbi:MAG TPA: BrnT family toxin [Burkholderiales bacterium]|nr:BrnT family toxin [Burkholderiales bacterium]
MALKYDPAKAAANLRKHGVSFSDAEGVFEDPLAFTIEDLDRARWRVPAYFSSSADAKRTETI